MNNNEIELVNKFMKITNISNKKFALGYLKKYNFDIENSIDAFFENNNIDPCNINDNSSSTEKNFSNLFSNVLSLQICNNCLRNKNTIESIFEGIPSLINKNNFEKNLQRKLCLFFIYDDESFESLKKILDFIRKNLYIMLKIEKYCVVLKDNYFSSGIELKLDKALQCPVLLFCYNNLNQKGFIKNSVKEIYKIKNDINDFPKFFFQTLKQFQENMNFQKQEEINEKKKEEEEIKDKYNNNNDINKDNFENYFNNNNIFLSDNKEVNQKLKNLDLNKKKNINKIFLQKPMEAKLKLPEEPNLNDHNTIIIQFQFPSDKRIERKFLINDKLELLYTYLISLDNKLYSELESKEFFLALSQPYVPLKDEYFDKTLSELNFHKTQILVILDLED